MNAIFTFAVINQSRRSGSLVPASLIIQVAGTVAGTSISMASPGTVYFGVGQQQSFSANYSVNVYNEITYLNVKVFSITGALLAEKNTTRPAYVAQYPCPYCGMIFNTQAELDAHIAYLHTVSPPTVPPTVPPPTVPPATTDYYRVYFTDGSTGVYTYEYIQVSMPPWVYLYYEYVGSW